MKVIKKYQQNEKFKDFVATLFESLFLYLL
jgi:hypothetical protein